MVQLLPAFLSVSHTEEERDKGSERERSLVLRLQIDGTIMRTVKRLIIARLSLFYLIESENSKFSDSFTVSTMYKNVFTAIT